MAIQNWRRSDTSTSTRVVRGKQMKSVSDHSESPFQQHAEYEPRTQTVDTSSNLDDFEELLAAAERSSKAAAGATAAGSERIGLRQQGFVQFEK
jgi:hypothetical protein